MKRSSVGEMLMVEGYGLQDLIFYDSLLFIAFLNPLHYSPSSSNKLLLFIIAALSTWVLFVAMLCEK